MSFNALVLVGLNLFHNVKNRTVASLKYCHYLVLPLKVVRLPDKRVCFLLKLIDWNVLDSSLVECLDDVLP